MKPITYLTPQDFTTSGVWEYVGDDAPEETWVRPTSCRKLTKGLYSQVVHTVFTLPRGDAVVGFMVVTTAGEAPYILPGALLSPSYLSLPHVPSRQAEADGYTWVLEERAAILEAFGCSDEAVFPLSYALQVPYGRRGELLRGTVE